MSSNSCLLQEMGQRLSDEILYYLEIQELLDFEEENSFKYVNDCLFVAFVCVCVRERERERERGFTLAEAQLFAKSSITNNTSGNFAVVTQVELCRL